MSRLKAPKPTSRTLRDYTERHDMATPEQPKIYYMLGYGSIVKVKGKGWYASNDCRWRFVGVCSNEELAQPTLGPFKTATEACVAREQWVPRPGERLGVPFNPITAKASP